MPQGMPGMPQMPAEPGPDLEKADGKDVSKKKAFLKTLYV